MLQQITVHQIPKEFLPWAELATWLALSRFARSGSTRTDPRTDQDLIKAVNRGDPAAFEVLYYRYRDWVFRLAWRFTGNEDEALDVLQDTFLYFLRKFPGFRLTARLTTFLYPAVKNLSLDRVKKKHRLVSNDDLVASTGAAPSADCASRKELSAVLASLPEAQREVLLMRFVDDMRLDDIADALQIPLGTVKSRVHNALRKLRNDERTRRYFQR